MKTKQNKNTVQSSKLQSRPEQLSGNSNSESNGNSAPPPPPQQGTPAKRILPFINHQERETNRALSSDKVLALLRQWTPRAYELAQVVGSWIWVTFPEPPAEQVRGQLSQFGFHWNNARKCWQHPCGHTATKGSAADPREKYSSHFAADQVAA